jgi:hypothetical protein
MQIDDSTVRWAIVTFGGGMLTLLAATWRSARLSRDAEKKLEMAEGHEKEIYGDPKANPPIKGLKAELIDLRNTIDSWKITVKGLARGHDVSSASDEHRIEIDVRRFHDSIAPEESERPSRPAQLPMGQMGPMRVERVEDEESTQQRRARMVREARPRTEDYRSDERGTPLYTDPLVEEVSDPFSGEDPPPPAARTRLPTPYGTGHSRVSPPRLPQGPGTSPGRRRRDDDEGNDR